MSALCVIRLDAAVSRAKVTEVETHTRLQSRHSLLFFAQLVGLDV